MITLPKRDSPVEIIKPIDAIARAAVPGTSWAVGVYSQVEASSDRPFVMQGFALGFAFFATGATSVNADSLLQLQLGVGQAGAEIVVAEAMDAANVNYTGIAGGQVIIHHGMYLPVEPVLIPVGSRTAVRAASSFTTAPFIAVYIVGYEPTYGFSVVLPWKLPKMLHSLRAMISGVAVPGKWRSKVIPSQAAGINVTPASTSWTLGAWVDFVNGASGNGIAGEYLILGVVPAFVNVNVHYQGEIGVGSAAQGPTRTAMFGLPGRATTNNPFPGYYELARPIACKAGEAACVRVKSSGASAVPLYLVIAECP